MMNLFTVLTPLVHGLVKLAGLKPQTIEIEHGTLMKIWVPKEVVAKHGQKTVYGPPKKPAVLLVHSFAFDGVFTWFLQVLALTREYSVYVPDLLFFGGSTTNGTKRSASFQAEFLAKGLEILRVERVTPVGISYGGIVGFKMAKMYPNLVKSLVVSATVIEMTEPICLAMYKNLGVSSWSDLLMPETMGSLKRLFSAAYHKIPWIPDFVYHDILETMFNNKKERNELLEDLVASGKYETIDTNYPQRIHLLWGDDDKFFDPEHAEALKMQLGKRTTLEFIQNAGHLLQLERPFAYNQSLKRFLQSSMQDQ